MILIKLNKSIIYKILLLSCFLNFYCIPMEVSRNFSNNNIDNINNKESYKPKILIMTSNGGGGHMSAANAIGSYYKTEFNIKPIKLLPQVLSNIDLCNKISLGKFNFEDLYNYLLKSEFTYCIQSLTSNFKYYLSYYSEDITKSIIKCLLEEKPNLVVSVMPIFNQNLLDACKVLSIPFIVLTVDYDTSNYANYILNTDYEKFYYTIPFDDELIKNKIKNLKLNNNLKTVGFPVRPDFFEEKDKQLIKKDFDLPDNKKIIMVLMGASGSTAVIKYLEEFSKCNLNLHLIICIGHSDDLLIGLTKIKLPYNLTITILGFTDRISDLMSVCDAIITKPGPTSISEALYLGKPILVDYTKAPLFWEKLNIDFIKKHKLGLIITDLKGLKDSMIKILSEKFNNKFKDRISKFTKENPKDKIKKLIDQCIS